MRYLLSFWTPRIFIFFSGVVFADLQSKNEEAFSQFSGQLDICPEPLDTNGSPPGTETQERLTLNPRLASSAEKTKDTNNTEQQLTNSLVLLLLLLLLLLCSFHISISLLYRMNIHSPLLLFQRFDVLGKGHIVHRLHLYI